MMRTRIYAAVVAALAGIVVGPGRASAGDEPRAEDRGRQVARLMSFDELERVIEQGGERDRPRILDVRPRMEYDRGHIPGAVWVDLRPIVSRAALPGGLEDPDGWAELLAPLGLEPGRPVVIYDARRQLDAARLWWLLGYLGIEPVALLDGGFGLWAREGRPVDGRAVEVEPTTAPVRLRPDRLADREEVLRAIRGGEAQVVDARNDREYSGEEAISGRGGHVPTARQLEWSDLVDSEGRFLPRPAVLGLMERAGLDPGRPAITHCQGGGRSSVTAFGLERLGVPTRNYYLGWSDWGIAEGCPVARGTDPGLPPPPPPGSLP